MCQTLYEMFQERAGRFADRPCLRFKSQGTYQTYTYSDILGFVQDLAHYLLSQAIQKGDRIALLSENRSEWAVADLSILAAGAVTVPIYPTLNPSEIAFLLRDSGARLLFLSTPEQLEKVQGLPIPKILFEKKEGSTPYSEVLLLGKAYRQRNQGALEERASSVKGEDLATLIYTSGTTGEPKGVMLTHHNFLSNCDACEKVIPISPADLYLSFLPLSHVFERLAGLYLMFYHGSCIAYAEDLERVVDNMQEIRPTLMAAVPRFFEKLHDGILQKIAGAPPLKRLLAQWALRVGHRHWLAQRLVFRPLRRRLGTERLRFFISGSAPLSVDLIAFFASLGLTILEGYGLTETSPVVAFNQPGRAKWGSVGQIIPGVEVKIAEDGEILVKGPNVMQGYFGRPKETAEAFREGYLQTGDIGHLDAEGFLFITDRKKDLIKTSGGKLIAPQKIESLLKSDPFIQEAVVFGDRQKYLVALICPDFEALTTYAREQGLGDKARQELLREPKVISLFEERLEICQRDLARFEKVKRFTLLDQPLTQGGGDLTPTLKVKRKVLFEKYKSLLDALYTED